MAVIESQLRTGQHTPTTAEASLLLPAYNEWRREEDYKKAIDGYQTFLGDRINNFNLIVFADGCEDSAAIAEAMGVTVMRHIDGKNHGKGEAIRSGLSQLRNTSEPYSEGVYGYTDADGSYSPEHMMNLFEAISSGYDLAVSHRVGKSDSSLSRRIAHVGMHKICELIAPTGIKDPQAGAKAFSGRFIDEILSKTHISSWALDRELASISHRDGVATLDLGTAITTHDNSTVRPLHDAVQMIIDSRRIRQEHCV